MDFFRTAGNMRQMYGKQIAITAPITSTSIMGAMEKADIIPAARAGPTWWKWNRILPEEKNKAQQGAGDGS